MSFGAEAGGIFFLIDLGQGGGGQGFHFGFVVAGLEFDQFGGEAGFFRAADQIGAAFACLDIQTSLPAAGDYWEADGTCSMLNPKGVAASSPGLAPRLPWGGDDF